MDNNILIKFTEYKTNKFIKLFKNSFLIEEFEFEGETIYIFDPVFKHGNCQLYLVTNLKEIVKGCFAREYMLTTRNQFNVVLIEFAIFDRRINLTKLIEDVSIRIAGDMMKRKENHEV